MIERGEKIAIFLAKKLPTKQGPTVTMITISFLEYAGELRVIV